jgi:hypothetical protein
VLYIIKAFRPICFVQVGLLSAPLSLVRGGDSVGLFEKPLLAAVTLDNRTSTNIYTRRPWRVATGGMSERQAQWKEKMNLF